MTSTGYTILGWVVYQVLSRVIKRKVNKNRTKVGAAGVVAAVLIGGAIAARSGSGDD
jgi:hypothetical protein